MFQKFFKYLFFSKKIWSDPRSCQIIVIDKQGSEVLTKVFSKFKTEIIAVRGESFYVKVLISSLFECLITKIPLQLIYLKKILQLSKPQLVITFIDNNHFFYKIKSIWPTTKTAFIQNAYRGFYLDIFSRKLKKKDNYVDYMFVFGSAIAKRYKKITNGKTIVIGSFLNNLAPVRKKIIQNNTVLFISQWRAFLPESKLTIARSIIDINELNRGKEIVCSFLASWCRKHSYLLQICGASNAKTESEYYRKLLKKDSYEYLPKTHQLSNYHHIDSANIVVCVDSTLGYEALARGSKVAFFNFQYKSWGCKASFGWEANFPGKGPFWTDKECICEFERILDFLKNIKQGEWKKYIKPILPKIIIYNKNNHTFTKKINQIICRNTK